MSRPNLLFVNGTTETPDRRTVIEITVTESANVRAKAADPVEGA